MVSTVLVNLCSFFDTLKAFWEGEVSLRIVSSILVTCFVISSILSFLVIYEYIDIGVFNENFRNPFFSVEIVFTLLLVSELLGLIFALPQSVAKSVGKQFEVLSLIFLRDGFKEFSRLDPSFVWDSIDKHFVFMITYGFGAIAIFSIIGFSYKLQKHIKLTNTEDDQEQFVRFKKVLGLLLLVAFVCVGYIDLSALLGSYNYSHSFHNFFTILIFSDIIIVLVALRYTHNYYKIFRYSAFVLATVLIRIALSVQPYYDVIIGVVAALFVLVLTFAYNYFLNLLPHDKKDGSSL